MSTDDETELLSSLIAFITAWTSVRTQGRIAAEVGVAIPESDVRALFTLGMFGKPVRPAQLADELQITRPTMSKMIGRLEESGLVTRSASTDDARGTLVSLTRAGSDAYARIAEAAESYVHAALDGVPPGTAQTISGVMRHLIDELPGQTDTARGR
ncbi:MarR family winged helix-turn-helix transcriptional regulator [Mycetocola zhujimingii]|uniref:MarR family transcriptional regulator n=1 Tax=Mycetocola zhujimingii TaxID=2079792 RepID=A0A2U1TC29_9MICO|nr:MarR family transcriptional regulator [Mycetocola zhujimingii]AWB87671.1 MarR family transcriptional regulator [Mycetocola zhujimingii]PWC06447.1 MarR family transcriptional regulator [Mycetocola zhujimingii]